MAKGRHPPSASTTQETLRMLAPPTQPRLTVPCAVRDTVLPTWREPWAFSESFLSTSAEPVFLYLALAGPGQGSDPVGGPPDWTPDWKRIGSLRLKTANFQHSVRAPRALGKETWLAAVNKGTERRKKGGAGELVTIFHSLLSPKLPGCYLLLPCVGVMGQKQSCSLRLGDILALVQFYGKVWGEGSSQPKSGDESGQDSWEGRRGSGDWDEQILN